MEGFGSVGPALAEEGRDLLPSRGFEKGSSRIGGRATLKISSYSTKWFPATGSHEAGSDVRIWQLPS